MSQADTAAPVPVSIAQVSTRAAGGRDLRLDFFRGLALWFIFIDHIPSSFIGNLTFRNFGFSDATEIFVFISGYTAALVYGTSLQRHGFAYMSLQVAKRVWQLYAAHLLVFLFFIGQILWVSTRFGNAAFLDELNVATFLSDPAPGILNALILRYRPVNLDVLPLYIVLLAGIPLLLALGRLSRPLTLLLSLLVWWGAQRYEWAFPVYEGGDTWYFNPVGWQLMFVIGALCASLRGQPSALLQWRPWLAWLCVLYLVFAAIIAVGWRVPAIDQFTKPLVGSWLYPIDKTDMGPARVLHFLATAYLVTHFVRPGAPFLSWKIAQPVILCGQHSLYIFCLGISLSFLAHFVLVEFGRSLPMQLVVVLGGLLLMTGLALQLHWFRARSRSGGGRPPPPAALAGMLLAALLAAPPRPAQASSAPVALPALPESGLDAPDSRNGLPPARPPAAPDTRDAARQTRHCQIPPSLQPAEARLPGLSAALVRNQGKVLVLVLGAQTRTTAASGRAEPGQQGTGQTLAWRLQERLALDLGPLAGDRLQVESLGKAHSTTAEQAALIGRQVIARKPALVIWALGRSDAIRSIPPAQVARALDRGLAQLRRQQIDTLVLDLPFHPQFEALYRTNDYRQYIRWSMNLHGQPFLRRYDMIDYWNATSRIDLDATEAQRQAAAAAFIDTCIAYQLSQMIDKALN